MICLAFAATGALGADEPGTLPLAIRGYDAVAYFTEERPTRGVPEFELVWDGHLYRFSTAAQRDLLRADPVRYAPRFEGLCAIALADGYKDEADPENWIIVNRQLYLFGGKRGPGRFAIDTAEKIARATDTFSRVKER